MHNWVKITLFDLKWPNMAKHGKLVRSQSGLKAGMEGESFFVTRRGRVKNLRGRAGKGSKSAGQDVAGAGHILHISAD